ncbi:MAG: PPC domain-containing protein, partial [Pirellulales bacterium]|nr:PPC domain-containing protein [Pirellulales bacterium]
MTAQSGSRVLIKDGETVIDDFVMPGASTSRSLTLAEGSHLLSAESFDASGNRSNQSEELILTVDRTVPAAPTLDLLESSDSFDDLAGLSGPQWTNSDGITAVNQPAYAGLAEANSIIRIYAMGISGTSQLVGEGIVGSDESDLVADDGLGTWEVTLEPLADGDYDVFAVIEDLAGNISDLSQIHNLVVDTLPPQRPTMDLMTASDTGMSDLDNVTNAPNLVPFTVTAEPGSRTLVKDGETVVADFIVPGSGTVTIALTLAEGTHLLSAEAFDASGNRSAQSEELVLTVDRTAPEDGDITIDLAASSDTGVVGTPYATSIRQPAFIGLAEANAQIRVFANGILVGEGVVGSDESDGVLDDNIGVWEVTVEPLADGVYTMTLEVEDLAGNITEATDSEDIIIDPFELNDTIDTATVLGSEPEITLRDVKLHDIDDVDYFQITANETGKLVINVFFDNTEGNVDIFVVDSLGNPIAESTGDGDNEQIVIPVVTQEEYYLQVLAPIDQQVIGNVLYDLEIENFAAPIPSSIALDPNDDSGMMNNDLITLVDDARIFITADLTEFVGMDIPILPAQVAQEALEAIETMSPLPDGYMPGVAVEVFANGASVGFADSLFGLNTIFEFAFDPTDVVNGPFSPNIPITTGTLVAPDNAGYFNMITAAVRVFDGQQEDIDVPDPATGRSQLSKSLNVHFDPNTPDAALATLAMADYSDTGTVGDNATSIAQPAFYGVAEENTRIRLFAERVENGTPTGIVELAGQSVVGSDTSDVGTVEGSTATDGLGLWEITVEPLQDGEYIITIELEDIAGNSSDRLDGPSLDIIIDTLAPQRPTIDLVGPDVVDNDVLGVAPLYSDTGMSTMDNVTMGYELIVGGDQGDTPADAAMVQVRVSAEPGSLVLIKDGEDV